MYDIAAWEPAVILVAAGNATQPFERLLDAVEHAWVNGDFGEEEVIVQLGKNRPREGVPWRQMAVIGHDEFKRLIVESTLVVCHAGAGMLLDVLSAGKRPVVIPRQRARGEHVDDHQLELAEAFRGEGRVLIAQSGPELRAALLELKTAANEGAPQGDRGKCLLSVVTDVLCRMERGRK